MHLITAAAAGIAGCEGGYITVKQRGSSTNATVYEDFEGENAVASTTTNHTLDANGATVLYANQVVDVVAYTSAGAEGRRWTEGASTPAIEYRGQSFTGTDYESAATGAQYPVTVQALLNKWKDSANALDWKVQKDALSTPTTWNLKSLGVTVGTAWYSVKDPVYGARGNGSTNDVAAIQAAIDAAEAAGGGVVVIPPGTYLTNVALVNDSDNVHIMGVGYPIIEVTAGNVNGFTLTADRTRITGVRIRLATSVGANSTAYAISASGCDYLTIEDVRVEYSASGNYKWLRAISASTCTYSTVRGCNALFADATATYAVLFASGSYNTIANSAINSSSTGGGVHFNAELDDVMTSSVVFSTGGASVTVTGTARVALTGNNFYSPAGTSLTTTGASRIQTAGNTWFTTTISVAANAGGVNSMYTDTPLQGTDLTAAATVSPVNPGVHKYYVITAHSANIDTITATGFPVGFILTLESQTNTQINDGSGNIKTAGANIVLTANDMVQFLWNGTNWLQMGLIDN
jgi:hypothetical protein